MKIVQFDLEHPILCNRYMLLDEASGEAAIIDPAWYEGVLENEIKNLDKNVKIKYILLKPYIKYGYSCYSYIGYGTGCRQ